MAERNFQISSGPACDTQELPRDFICMKVLGEGGFGRVLQCLRKGKDNRKQTVAVKIPKFLTQDNNEVSILEKLMLKKLDQKNIIQFLGWFPTYHGKALVFESLDISLESFIVQRNCKPMLLGDIRDIIEQLATAFEALKSIRVIHTDLKIDNVMMVNHKRRPYGVKLIDFGLAIPRSKASQGDIIQVIPYRAPEISLGLPYSEAIDVWSLGSVMAAMLHGGELFPVRSENEMVMEIVGLLGFPAHHFLDAGLRTRNFFIKAKSGRWRLKTSKEFGMRQRYKPLSTHSTLDRFRRLRVETGNKNEAVLRPLCIDLLEAMVTLDQAKRITPKKILSHPFITWREQNTNTKRKRNVPPQGVIQVRPAAAKNRLVLDIKEEASEVKLEPPAAVDQDQNMDTDPSAGATPQGVILVRPAAAENTLLQQEEDEDTAPKLKTGLKASSVKRTDRDSMPETQGCTSNQKKEQKKRKNCVRRLFSWFRKNFGSCCSSNNEDQDN